MQSQATLQGTRRAPVCISICKVQCTVSGTCTHRAMRFAVHMGKGGGNASALRAPETLVARDASGLGYLRSGVADRLILRSGRRSERAHV